MPVEGVPGTAVAATAAGALLVWSGVRGHSVSASLRSLVSGQAPPPPDRTLAVSADFAAAPAAGGPGGTGAATPPGPTGSAISDAALKYEGHCYSYGGAPGPSGTRCWDCSSFCNWVIGHDLGREIPGYAAGTYKGQAHGPATGQWVFAGQAVPGGAGAAVAGDLLVWSVFHMGIALGGGRMISALNPRLGTRVTPIAGYGTGPLSVRRI